MQLRATWRSLAERRLKSLLGGVVVALGAVAVVATPAAGGGQVPHLEAHGKAILVYVEPLTDVATVVGESTIHVSAWDTCPPQTSDPPTCVDRAFISFGGVHPPSRGDGYYVQVDSHPTLSNIMFLRGYELMFVDGGEPGTAAGGPTFPGGAGITPTQDYAQYVVTPTSSRYRWYFVAGGVQITGTG